MATDHAGLGSREPQCPGTPPGVRLVGLRRGVWVAAPCYTRCSPPAGLVWRSAMADLPTGTVTFLLTDIAGSTRLWEQDAAAMRQALARHDALIETSIVQYGGVVVRPRGEGDSRFAVFARATDAVAAAAHLQQALWAEVWPTA